MTKIFNLLNRALFTMIVMAIFHIAPSQSAPSQSEASVSEHSLIEKLLKQNYIDGSSYNKTDALRSAFANNATFFLTIKDEYKKLSLNDYLSLFENDPGKFNGRYGKVLSIEVVQDIANAKVEISIPERKISYIDMFLLKKTSNGWKVISKTATKIDKTK